MSLFPMFLKLAGRRCVVIGAGRIAEPKVASLIRAGADVLVVARRATPRIAAWSRRGNILLRRRRFTARDLRGASLIISASNSPELRDHVFREACSRGIFCNSVDDPLRCDFYYPAVVRRGPLQIAISTSGASPALAQRLRRELERQFTSRFGDWVGHLGKARDEILAQTLPAARRLQILRRIAEPAQFLAFSNHREQSAREDGMNHLKKSGKVYLVGAGPGDPGLLTVKALSVLQTADVVLHDDLVTPEILALIRTACVKSAGKRCGQKKISQREINSQMIELAQAGLTVARLKGGDPLIFGRAAEEIEALRAAAIEFEIVPGVTAASAAAASAGIPLTDRHSAPHLMFASGCHCRRDNVLRAGALSPNTTLALYMPGSDYGGIARDLLAAGLDDSAPCLIVSCASRKSEKIQRTTVGELASLHPIAPPAVLIIGDVTARWASRAAPRSDSGTRARTVEMWNAADAALARMA